MSTFFEKLTGATRVSKTPSSTNDTKQTKDENRNKREIPVAKEKEIPHHLKIETEGEEEGVAPAEPEEEGELTVDIYDTGDHIVIQSTVAGVKPEDLDVSITDDTVSIRGRREKQEKIEEKNYFYKELFWGTFSRTIILPEEVDDEEAEAVLKHGLLSITLPKKRRGVTQKLKVKVS